MDNTEEQIQKLRERNKEVSDDNKQKINSDINQNKEITLQTVPQNYRQQQNITQYNRCNGKKDENSTRYDKKLMIKKPKITIDNFSQYIPEFLILINQQKHKSVIRIGKNYQANISGKCMFSYLYRPLTHLKIWSAGEVQGSIIKKFREKFGENRTEEDLCMLMFQYQCDLDQINHYISEYKGELRKVYLQRDRTKA